MQKWEYLFIRRTGVSSEHHIEVNGKIIKKFDARTALSKIFSELGEQGWEFVSGAEGYLFKRPKP